MSSTLRTYVQAYADGDIALVDLCAFLQQFPFKRWDRTYETWDDTPPDDSPQELEYAMAAVDLSPEDVATIRRAVRG